MKELQSVFSGEESKEMYAANWEKNLVAVVEHCMALGEPAQNEPCHRFSDGVYARELFIGAGELIVGKKHKTEHFNIISKGDISIATQEGVMRVEAPYTFVSKAGIQKIVYAHTDTVWTTIHKTDLTDIPTLEREMVEEALL